MKQPSKFDWWSTHSPENCNRIDKSWLIFNRNNYKGYNLESKLHFRVHSVLSQIKMNGSSDSADNVDGTDNPASPGLGLEDDEQTKYQDFPDT